MIDSPYSTDGQYTYFRDKPIIGADAPSFEIINVSHSLSKDRNHVYYKENIVLNATPSKFKSNAPTRYKSGQYKWRWRPGGNEEDTFSPIN